MPRPASTSPGNPLARARSAISTRRLALYVLFASISMLFGATMVGYLVTRAQSPLWRTAEMPALPAGLWLSTLLIVAISATFQSAISAIRQNRSRALLRRLWFGTGLVVLFLSAQAQNWLYMERATVAVQIRTLYPYTFYMLTGLHGAHVLGGLVPLGLVIHRARRNEYSSSSHEGVDLCVLYWHYLGVVWLLLFTALKVFS
jgi:cytochrome c oxidase subunit 3